MDRQHLDLSGKFREAQDIFASKNLDPHHLALYAWPADHPLLQGEPTAQMVAFVCRQSGSAVIFNEDVPRWVDRFLGEENRSPFTL